MLKGGSFRLAAGRC